MLRPFSPAQRCPRPPEHGRGEVLSGRGRGGTITSPRHRKAHRTGLWAEALSRCALALKGYRIVASRYRSKLGEIDIVAVRGRTLAFIEVKARPSRFEAGEAISAHQRERLTRAAADFLARHPRYARHNSRFDAMLVTPWRWPEHIPGAWEVTQ